MHVQGFNTKKKKKKKYIMNLKGWEIILLMKIKNLERITSRIILKKIKMIHPWFGKEFGIKA